MLVIFQFYITQRQVKILTFKSRPFQMLLLAWRDTQWVCGRRHTTPLWSELVFYIMTCVGAQRDNRDESEFTLSHVHWHTTVNNTNILVTDFVLGAMVVSDFARKPLEKSG